MSRIAAAVLSLVIGLGGVLVWSPGAATAAAGDDPSVDVVRYGGADRYATSLLVAEALSGVSAGSLSRVVLVSGERWTDAVVAASAAGTSGAPVLMNPPDALRDDALEFLLRAGVTDALVIGPDTGGGAHGPGSGIGAAVLEALEEAGITAERVSGSDRYGTGVAVARQVTPGVMAGMGRTAIVTSGEVFANGWSLSDVGTAASLVAAGEGDAVVFAETGTLGGPTSDVMTVSAPTRVVLVGGTAALNADVHSEISRLVPGVSIERFAGTDRIDTAARAARRSLGDSTGGTLVLANGWSLSDVGTAASVVASGGADAVLYSEP